MISQKKKIDNYTVFLDRKIGEGSFGKVYIGEQDKTNLKVAVKMLDKKTIDKDEYIKNALLAEISILKTLKSPNIVGFLDVMESSNFYYLVQECCEGGDLRALIKKRAPIPEPEAIKILTEICHGFIEMLKEGVIHRDLKPENILISKGVMKICDFGFSKKGNSKRMKHLTIVGTPLYMSLEILKGKPYTSKCDIWALGFIFYELLYGNTPWDADSQYQLIQNIENQPLKFPRPISPQSRDLLTRCLQAQQKDRINWDSLLRHEIFSGFFSSYVKQEHEFENKFKYLMGQIRFKITSQNIDLQRLFERHGYNKNTELKFQHFQQFMKTIDSSLTPEEQRYIFEKLDVNESNSISLGELQAAMVSNNIPMTSCYKPERKDSLNSEGQPATGGISVQKLRMIELKIISAFNKLSAKMHKNGITLIQVFEAYDVNKDGGVTIKEFQRILKRLDETLSDEDIKEGFILVDSDHSNQITFQEFMEYFCKCTGQPLNDFMAMRVNK